MGVDETLRDGVGDKRTSSLVGALLGAYRIDRLLGEGAMGEVFAATHVALARPVAIKTLKPIAGNARELTQRFFNEARAVNVIRHENIVECTDLVNDPEGRSYIVMELLDGRTLRDAITAAGKLSIERTAHIANQIADAIGAAHAKGIIHRDLKPDNIFLITRAGSSDYVKVLDFGIARLLDSSPAIGGDASVITTRTGVMMGAPAYMSPEAVRGEPVLPTGDIYALGVILFQMLTGRLPFEVTLPMMLVAQLHETPPRADEVEPTVPRALADLIARMLAKDAAARPADMAVFRRELALATGAQDAIRTLDEPSPTPTPVHDRRALEVPPTDRDPRAPDDPPVPVRRPEPSPVRDREPPPPRYRAWLIIGGALALVGTVIVLAWKLATGGDPAAPPSREPPDPEQHLLGGKLTPGDHHTEPAPAPPPTPMQPDAQIVVVAADAAPAPPPPKPRRIELPTFGALDPQNLPGGYACTPGRAFKPSDADEVFAEIRRDNKITDAELDAELVARGTTRAAYRARITARLAAVGCRCPSGYRSKRDAQDFAICKLDIPEGIPEIPGATRSICGDMGKAKNGGGCSCADGWVEKRVDNTFICAKRE